MDILNSVKDQVYSLLSADASGHGADHIERVLTLSLRFAEAEGADTLRTSLIALLHDVDDYKLFGKENALSLPNARAIMQAANVPYDIQESVISDMLCIGYNKRISGIVPISLEAMAVSDADMCDALGVIGVLRAYRYSIKDKKPFFDRHHFPIEDMSAEQYKTHDADSTVCHIFEKILKLKDLMLTDAGRAEAQRRHEIVVEMLEHLFEEERAPEWTQYLKERT